MTEFAGRSWLYQYTEIPGRFTEASCRKVADGMFERYARITKEWSIERNTEWFCRIYTSGKLIMDATLKLNSMRYAQKHNLRVVVPYLTWYSLLSLLRAIVLGVPEKRWDNGELAKIGHEKAINSVADVIRSFDANAAELLADELKRARAARELISYRAPSSGDLNVATPEPERIIGQCRLLAEIAQFNSEIFEASVIRNASPDTFALSPCGLKGLYSVDIAGQHFTDTEDLYRANRYFRKEPRLTNLYFFFQQGHVEDFFGAWSDSNPEDAPGDLTGAFDPDEDYDLIFNLP